jgi:hypothetical protein
VNDKKVCHCEFPFLGNEAIPLLGGAKFFKIGMPLMCFLGRMATQ